MCSKLRTGRAKKEEKRVVKKSKIWCQKGDKGGWAFGGKELKKASKCVLQARPVPCRDRQPSISWHPRREETHSDLMGGGFGLTKPSWKEWGVLLTI